MAAAPQADPPSATPPVPAAEADDEPAVAEAPPPPVEEPIVANPAEPATAVEPADVPVAPALEPSSPVAEAPEAPEAPVATAPPPGPSLDLDGLEQRLRKTKAIGLFTKIELKNQVNDLLKQFDQFHGNGSPLNLAQLEERFDLLMMKVLLLVQDGDPPLHRDIADAREALWAALADPMEYADMRGS